LTGDQGRVDVGHDEASGGHAGQGSPTVGTHVGRPGGRARARPRAPGAAAQGSTTVPLGTTVTPDSVTTNPRATSCSWSTPTRARGWTTTFLSRIARCTWACRPMFVPSMTTESLT